MRLVIDIPEELYNHIKNDNVYYLEDGENLYDIVKNGTPLPKGHGRLIDADSLKEAEQKWSCDYEQDGFSHVVEIRDIDNAPTIIEADKE